MLTLSGSARIMLGLTGANAVDLGTKETKLSLDWLFSFLTGAGALQINELFRDTRTLADGATEDLDLSGTALTNDFGVAIAFARVKIIAIRNKSTSQLLTIGGAASAQFSTLFGDPTDKIVLRPGGAVILIAPDATGYAVTATTADMLKIANGSAGSATDYDIAIAGSLT